jgi:hypothetical protein
MILLEQFIIEGRIDDAKAKYPEHEDAIDYLVGKDTSGNNKYLMWAAKQVAAGESELEVAYLLTMFHDSINKIDNKDINSYKDLAELDKAIEQSEQVQTKGEKKREVKREGVKEIHEDDRWWVIEPLTWEASCIYGRDTKWCISARDQPHHWPTYKQFGAAFAFVRDKSKPERDPLGKLAITFHPQAIVDQTRNEWENSNDQQKDQRIRGLERQFGGEVTRDQLESIIMTGAEVYGTENNRIKAEDAEAMLGSALWNKIRAAVVADHDVQMPSRQEMEDAMRRSGIEIQQFESVLRTYIKKSLRD